MSAREPLPGRRYSETFKMRHGDLRSAYHVTIGCYPDGRIGEIFISTNQVGTAIDALARDTAVLMSLCLQHGCRMETMRDALTREQNGAPSTVAAAVADRLTGATKS
jgi:hypothetical protein